MLFLAMPNQTPPPPSASPWKIVAVVFGGLAMWELLQFSKRSR